MKTVFHYLKTIPRRISLLKQLYKTRRELLKLAEQNTHEFWVTDDERKLYDHYHQLLMQLQELNNPS